MTTDKRFLAVDQGNSFFKLTLFCGEEIESVCRIPSADADEIFNVVDSWRPDCGCFCSVGRLDSRLVESLRLALGGDLMILSHSTPLPIGMDYSTPSTLGLDRIALAAGCAALCGDTDMMVVDAGTAVTLDVVASRDSSGDGEGQLSSLSGLGKSVVYIGGRIAPGLRLRFEALHHFTAALPLVSAYGPIPVAGDSTDTSIRSGVVLGLADEIVETFHQYQKAYGCRRLLITGGDAGLLFNRISTRIPADHVPDLMARGLYYIYHYNENK